MTFLVLVVALCAAASGAAVKLADTAWGALRFSSDARVARAVLASLEQDLGAAVDSLVAAAVPIAAPDSALPAVRRAMRGDTVTGIGSSPNGLEVSVVYGVPRASGDAKSSPGDAVHAVLHASAPLTPSAVQRIERSTGYGVALFLNGRRWVSGPGSPRELSHALRVRLSYPPNGESLVVSGATGAAIPMDPSPGSAAAVVAVAAPREARPPPVTVQVRLVIGVVLLFAVLAGWIQLARRRSEEAGPVAIPTASAASVVMLGLLPALGAIVLLVHLTRSYDGAVRDTLVVDLARGMAVATDQRVAGSPGTVRMLTNLHATVLRDGAVRGTTFPNADLTALIALPSPPTSFQASGSVETPEGLSLYLSRRFVNGDVAVLTLPWPGGEVRRFRRDALAVGTALTAWLALVGGAVAFRRVRVSSGR